MPTEHIPHESLITAFKAICPDNVGTLESMCCNMPKTLPVTVREVQHDYAVYTMIERLVANCYAPADSLHELIDTHTKCPKIQKRVYQLVFRQFYRFYLPMVKFYYCIAAEKFDVAKDLKNPDLTVVSVNLDSLKDRIDIPDEMSEMSCIPSDYDKELNRDCLPGSIFEQVAWPMMRADNQYNDSTTNDVDDYDEDYL